MCSNPVQASVNLRNLLADSRILTSSLSMFSSTLLEFRFRTCCRRSRGCQSLLLEEEAGEVGVEGEVGRVLVASHLWRQGVDAMSCGLFWRKCTTVGVARQDTTLVTLAQFEFEPVVPRF